MTQTLDIYQTDDGFFVGRQCKSGKLAKGAYKLTGNDIMTMFTQFFQDYCRESGRQQLLMQTDDGQTFVTMRVPADKAGETKE